MTRLLRAIVAATAGAATMYYFDPNLGRRRRAILCDKACSMAHDVCDFVEGKGRHTVNKARGVVHTTRRQMGLKPQPLDYQLHEQVRAKLGHLVSYARAIEVQVNEGRVTLAGHVLSKDKDKLLSAIVDMHGVHGVVNKLTVHETPGNIPELQGAS